MTMSTALSIANSGLANIDAQIAILSQNVANAATPGWVAESSTQYSVTAAGIGMGVHTGAATRAADEALRDQLRAQTAVTAGLQTTQSALQAIDTVMGTPGQGADIGSMIGKLQDSFATLLTDPANQAQQSAVIAAAGNLTQTINTISAAYTGQRQAAQDNLAASISTLNNTLNSISQVSKQIVTLRQAGASTADLENQRDGLMQALSGLVTIKAASQPNGDLSIVTTSGLVLPTDGTAAFSVADGSVGSSAYYPGGGLSGVMLKGQDVTAQLTGGQIGADLTLRDGTLPAGLAGLDEFAYGLASRFSAQGLTLFTDASGNLPQAAGASQVGYTGLSSTIRVNQAVVANPALVRDGTDTVADSTTGASAFTPNPTAGPSGFTGLISRILNYSLTDQMQAGIGQPALQNSGLGPTGTLSVPVDGSGSLLSYANGLVAAQSQESASATGSLDTASSLKNALSTRLSGETGVNMDKEMSQMLVLQNAYSANARVLNALQAMFNQLLQAVQ